MRSPALSLLAVALTAGGLHAQTLPVPDPAQVKAATAPKGTSTTKPDSAANPATSNSNEVIAASLERLTKTNQDLLDLLKKQQAVLEDIQFDRRLQARQMQSYGERLAEALEENAKLRSQIAKMEATASYATANPAPAPTAVPAPKITAPAPVEPPPPPKPTSGLPPAPDIKGAIPGQPAWHRLFTLSGTDTQSSDLFHVKGSVWRVVWHNQDKDGKEYRGTSALFIYAYPKDDTIPQKVCAKVGTGDGSVDLQGSGNYYLKVEASGGSWELAVEDFSQVQ